MITSNNPAVCHAVVTVAQYGGDESHLIDAIRVSMQNTSIYAATHTGAATALAPSMLAAAFHPHVLADAAVLIAATRGTALPSDVYVYNGAAWVALSTIEAGEYPGVNLDPFRPKRAPSPLPPPPSPGIPSPPGITVPPALEATLAQIDAVFAPKAEVEAVTVTETPVTIPLGATPQPIVVETTGEALPTTAEQSNPYVQPAAPAASLTPPHHGGKGRPPVSPWAKPHPLRSRVGKPHPFWRDMLPMATHLLSVPPYEVVKDNTLGTLEAYSQLLHIAREILTGANGTATADELLNYVIAIQDDIRQTAAWPAISHSQNTYNAGETE